VDEAHYWRHPAVPGVDLMRAHYVRHGFARHAHDTFAIGTVRMGAETMSIGAETHRIGAGGVVLLNPETVHDGHPASRDGVRYRVFYPEVAVVAEAVGRHPWFADPVVHDPAAAAAMLAAHRAAESDDRLTSGTLLVELLSFLGHRHGGGVRRTLADSGGRAVAAAREILHERLVDPPSLRELAAAVGTGQYALVRAFRARHGLPPHAYLTQLRVRAARALLDAGVPPAQVAVAVGFTDQPHLGRHFRRAVGVAPGHYQRKNVQDRRGAAL
jgi:AraC-like DNA-binding protein